MLRLGKRMMRHAVFLAATVTAAVAFTPGAPAQDAEAGAKVFNQCRACHMVGENVKPLIGPPLNGIVGAKAGGYPGFAYSEANKNSGMTWDEVTLAAYLPDPKAKMPGTKMAFAGVKSAQQIADLIAFLKQYDSDGKKK